MLHGIQHCRFGDLVEDHSGHLLAAQSLAAAQLLADMPGDRLALAIRIGGEDEPIGGLEGLGDGLDAAFGFVVDLPAHGEVFLGTHRSVLGRQIAHMAEARQDRVIGPEILIDGLRLGRRFDDDDIHRCGASSSCPDFICWGASNGTLSTDCQERDAVAGMPLQTSGQLEFQQRHPQKWGRQLTLPEQFVNRHRAGAEQAFNQGDGGF